MESTNTLTGKRKPGRRPKDSVSTAAGAVSEQELKEQEETKQILAQIRQAAEAEDPEIDGLTAEDVLSRSQLKKNRKRYYRQLAKGLIINDENAEDQIQANAVFNIKRLKKEAKAINKELRGSKLPDEEIQKLESRVLKIDNAIEKEKTRAAELMRRLEN